MKILLATDGSEAAKEAATLLSRLPHREPLELTVVTAIAYPRLHPADIETAWPSELWDQLNVSAQETLDEIRPMFQAANATLSEKIIEGHAGESIVKEAKTMKADLIVLGAKGHTAIGRILLGSVSDYVATHAPCSVLVIRPSLIRRDTSSLSVTIGYDGSKRANFALSQFTQFDWGPSVRTHLLVVVPVVRFFGQDVLPDKLLHREQQHEIASQAAVYAAQQLTSAGTHSATKVSSQIVDAEHIGDAIAQAAKDNSSDLVVVGDTGMSGIGRMLLGSVSRYVLRHTECSVWLAREKS